MIPKTNNEASEAGLPAGALFGSLGVQALQRKYGLNYVQASKLHADLARPTRHWPYRATLMDAESIKEVWWPESSHDEDSMVIGDGIPGDKKTAELCARCCNIAYEQALEDVAALLEGRGLDVSKTIAALTLPNEKSPDAGATEKAKS